MNESWGFGSAITIYIALVHMACHVLGLWPARSTIWCSACFQLVGMAGMNCHCFWWKCDYPPNLGHGKHGSMYWAGIGEVGGINEYKRTKEQMGFIYWPFWHPCSCDPCPWSMATALFSFFLMDNFVALGRGRSSSLLMSSRWQLFLPFVFWVFGRQCGQLSSGINHIVITVIHLKKVAVEMSVSMGTSEVSWSWTSHPQAQLPSQKIQK